MGVLDVDPDVAFAIDGGKLGFAGEWDGAEDFFRWPPRSL